MALPSLCSSCPSTSSASFPASSFPACIAVKCAELQSPSIAAQYLQALQEAVMVESKNISKTNVLLEAAAQLAKQEPDIRATDGKDDQHERADSPRHQLPPRRGLHVAFGEDGRNRPVGDEDQP